MRPEGLFTDKLFGEGCGSCQLPVDTPRRVEPSLGAARDLENAFNGLTGTAEFLSDRERV